MIDDPAWRRAVHNPERIVRAAARAACAHATVVLTTDRVIRRLNAAHRGSDRPTNVLTFDPMAPGAPGEILLALETVRREALAAGKRIENHLAHLVIHGSLHLQGHDHHHVREARLMEMTETRLMRRLGRPNPWKSP